MPAVKQHEDGWLRYCRRIVRDEPHRLACARRGGSPPEDARVFADVRWPGYLGPGYEPGGLLWVNIIHEDLRQEHFGEQAEEIAVATRRWRDADPGDAAEDEQYLSVQQRIYSEALRTWKVGHLIRDVATETLGISVDQMAYLNAARCQAPMGTTAWRRQDLLVKFCQNWWPLEEALTALDPALLVIGTAAMLRQLPPQPSRRLAVGVFRHQIQRGSPWKPAPGQPWREALAEDWTEHRRRQWSPGGSGLSA
jgi:hypothetical protein